MANVMTAMIEPFRKMTPKLSCVPYDYGTTGIAYNTKYITDAVAKEKGAMLLVDKAYAGKIGALNDMVTRVWYGAFRPARIRTTSRIWRRFGPRLARPAT